MTDKKHGHPIARRVVTALATAAGAVALFLWCPLKLLPPLLMLLSALVQLEFYQMVRRYDPVSRFGMLLGTLWIGLTAMCPGGGDGFMGSMAYGALALPIALFLLSVYVLFRPSYAHPAGTVAVTLLGFFYVPFLISFFLRIVQLNVSGPAFAMPISRVGLYTLFALLAATKLSDMGGFAFGMAFGRHKMCPSISPKKSWEGFAGSVVGATVMTLVFRWVAVRNDWAVDCAMWDHVTVPVAVAAGVAIATVGTLGDLIESRFKREFGIKDSATFMPAGMGGFLDMFDSILFVPALFYPLIMAFSR